LSVQNTKNKQNGNNIPNGHKVYENALKQALQTYNIHNIFHCKLSKMYPKWDFFGLKIYIYHLATLLAIARKIHYNFTIVLIGMYMQSSAIFVVVASKPLPWFEKKTFFFLHLEIQLPSSCVVFCEWSCCCWKVSKEARRAPLTKTSLFQV
jgi:hypothetical protein